MNARIPFLSTLLLVAACGEEGFFGGGSGTPDDPATACNEANEDCGPGVCSGEGGTMLPGANCLACHDGSGAGGEGGDEGWEEDESEGGAFTVAGTVFSDADGNAPAEGAVVRITDANGTVVELTANSAGNFYTSQALVFPVSAEVEYDGAVLAMGTTPDTGACNSCHACSGAVGAKLYAP